MHGFRNGACFTIHVFINQQDAQNSCDQTLFSIRCAACFGMYQSIIRSNFISCTSHIPIYALPYVWLLCGFYMFRTVLVHYQEQLYKLYIAYTDICPYHTSGCCVAFTCFGLYQSIIRSNFISCTSHFVYAGTSGIYQIRCTAYKIAPDDGLIQSETCRTPSRK